jgi:hypothetical protein
VLIYMAITIAPRAHYLILIFLLLSLCYINLEVGAKYLELDYFDHPL